jgi:hypothetical protein
MSATTCLSIKTTKSASPLSVMGDKHISFMISAYFG